MFFEYIGAISSKEYSLEKITEEAHETIPLLPGNLSKVPLLIKPLIAQIFADYKPTVVVNLAAQAGVRYSITNPDVYIEVEFDWIL